VPDLRLEPLLRMQVSLATPLDLGDTPVGRRRIIPVTGGTFEGARLRGRVLPGGADWQVVRTDGVAVLDARHTLETDDGALIGFEHRGYRHGPADVIAKLASGAVVDPGAYYMRMTPWFETGDARYAWLNRLVCVASGARQAGAVHLEVFEVR